MIEWFRGHIEQLNLQANVLRFWHRVVVIVCSISVIMQIAGWIVAFARVDELYGRHGVAIIGVILTVITLILNYCCIAVWEPHMLTMIALQMICLVALFFVASSGGTLALVVDLCRWDESGHRWSCGAVAMEYFAAWVNASCLVIVFTATQKRIIMLTDRGIFTGVGGRMSRVE